MIFAIDAKRVAQKLNIVTPSPDKMTVTFEEAILLNFHVGSYFDESPNGSPTFLKFTLYQVSKEFLADHFCQYDVQSLTLEYD